MTNLREIRDTIHGFVSRSEAEEDIIDSTVFQRLRNIRQLAMANLVYPGALHTRFDHSIGVMHISSKIAKSVGIDDDEILQAIRFAALLHDIGHGPFSHVSEQILSKYCDKKKVLVEEEEEIHESITCDIIRTNKELEAVISEKVREKIIDLISSENQEAKVKSIITGPLDADKLDYLLRDSYYCGVKYGIYDIDRLLNTIESIEQGLDQIIVIREGGIFAVEQFVICKYHMSSQVYRHKIRVVTDEMLVRGLELGIELDKINFLRDLFTYDRSNDYINNYLEYNDFRLLNRIIYETPKDSYVNKIFTRLLNRKLFKRVFHIGLNNFGPIVRDELSNLKENPKLKKLLEQNIAKIVGDWLKQEIDPNLVLMVVLSIKSVRAEKVKDYIGSIPVKMDDGKLLDFTDCSTLFKSINEKEKDEIIEVYAPVDLGTETMKTKYRAELEKIIYEFLNNNTLKLLN